MRKPKRDRRMPRTVLYELAITGPSQVRAEAIRLLDMPNLPTKWPRCPWNSSAAARWRLATTRGKAAKLRLQALKELLWPVTEEQREVIDELRKGPSRPQPKNEQAEDA